VILTKDNQKFKMLFFKEKFNAFFNEDFELNIKIYNRTLSRFIRNSFSILW